eukprot:Hpha_TRINITY_DN34600_c0_g1::TRINITY_DN34600_c0_g1_i1::g.21086::m.21086
MRRQNKGVRAKNSEARFGLQGSQGVIQNLLRFNDTTASRSVREEDERMLLHFEWCQRHGITKKISITAKLKASNIRSELGTPEDFDRYADMFRHVFQARHLFYVALMRYMRCVKLTQSIMRRYMLHRVIAIRGLVDRWEAEELRRRAKKKRQLALLLPKRCRLVRQEAQAEGVAIHEGDPNPRQTIEDMVALRERVFDAFISLRVPAETKIVVANRMWRNRVGQYIKAHREWRSEDGRQFQEPKFNFTVTVGQLIRETQRMLEERAERRLRASRRRRFWAMAHAIAGFISLTATQRMRRELRGKRDEAMIVSVNSTVLSLPSPQQPGLPGLPGAGWFTKGVASKASTDFGWFTKGVTSKAGPLTPEEVLEEHGKPKEPVDASPLVTYGVEQEEIAAQEDQAMSMMAKVGSWMSSEAEKMKHKGSGLEQSAKRRMVKILAVEQAVDMIPQRAATLEEELSGKLTSPQARRNEMKQRLLRRLELAEAGLSPRSQAVSTERHDNVRKRKEP